MLLVDGTIQTKRCLGNRSRLNRFRTNSVKGRQKHQMEGQISTNQSKSVKS